MFDVTTYAYNSARTGESSDTTISPANVGTLAAVWHHAVGYETQPVIATKVTNVPYDGGTHNIVYVGAFGTFTALDAYTGVTLWTKSVPQGQQICVGEPAAPFGISGTPVIDRSANVIYVPDGIHQIHALDLASGGEKAGWPVDLVASGSDDGSQSDLREFLHTALTLVNGKIYAGTSSTCDLTPWKGRVAMIDVASHTLLATFYPVFGQGGIKYSGGGVWGWGGVSYDGSAIYTGVGNADTNPQSGTFVNTSDETVGYGEHILRLSTDLSTVQDWNIPIVVPNPASASDIDLSGTPVLFQPPGCNPLLAVQGKAGFLMIYNRNNLIAGPIFKAQFSESTDTSHYIGNPAYSSQTGYLYASVANGYGGYQPGMAILKPSSNCSQWTVVNPAFGPDSIALQNSFGGTYPRSALTVANGVAFIGTPDGVLWARDAVTGVALWDSTSLWAANTSATGDQIRMGPVVTGGWVYVVQVNSGTLWALKASGATSSSSLRRGIMTQPLPAPPIIHPPFRRH